MRGAVLLSGGLDSTTCLALAKEQLGTVDCISVSYGQKHAKELECAEQVAKHYGAKLHHLDLTGIFKGASCSLLGHGEVPEGAYSAQKEVTTLVPFRNGLFLAAIASKVLSIEADTWVIYIGTHLDDAASEAYPDCSTEFTNTMAKAIYLGTGGKVSVAAPFKNMNKADIVMEGLRLGVPYEKTWSCYNGGTVACGRCATCLDRLAAFRANNVSDPISYE